MAYLTESLSKEAMGIETYISKKHFNRKHGPDKYYGQ
jgi:L-ribulose-5-phosphate 4-epimerase